MTGRQHLAGLDAEIQDHIEREAQELVERGFTPEAARAEARRKFGNVTLAKETTRAVWYPVWLEQAWQDFRGSLRMVKRSPGFSAIVILTLALAIGLNVAVFSVVNTVLLRPLAFPHPDRMVWLGLTDARDSDEFATSVDVLAWKDAASLAHIVAYDLFDGRITDGGNRGSARIASVSEEFWALSGARAELGRLPETTEAGVMLSRSYFERRFGADPAVIGRTITVGDRRSPVAGVLPRGFHVDLVPPTETERFARKDVDVYEVRPVPVLQNGMVMIVRVFAELKPGVSLETARAELETIHLKTAPAVPIFRQTLRVLPLKDRLVEHVRPALFLLQLSVGFVLLVGGANLAALLLARATARRRELAIRTAIGAGRGRVLRQLLIETLVLATSGGLAGLLLARAFLEAATRLVPDAVPRLTSATIETPALLFAFGLTLVMALVFGLAPALTTQPARLYDRLTSGTRAISDTLRRVRYRTWLVTGEIALTVVLLCGAGLLVRSLWRLTTYPPGFAPEHVLTVTVQYDGEGQDRTGVKRRQYTTAVLDRLTALPGLEAAGMSTNQSGRLVLFVENAPPVPDTQRVAALHSAVSSGYARAIGMRLVGGRWLTDVEPQAAVVVNETLARHVFAGDNPIGHRLLVGGPRNATEAQGAQFATIVGVVEDLKYTSLDLGSEPEVFADYAHAFPFVMSFVARVSGDPTAAKAALRALVAEVDPSQPVSDVKTVETVLIDSIASRRFTLLLFSTFAGMALLLALIGVYGVIAYSVSLRTGEIGMRIALGAERRTVLWMFLRQGLAIASVGMVVGLAIAVAVTRVMSSLLYEVKPTDITTFIVVSAGMMVTVAMACFGPALRAASVEPLNALRYE